MIDVIIPAYNSYETIDRTLSSIALQDIIENINVYIVNDGSKYSYEKYVKFYSKFMNIKELSYKNNKGPGYAREYGIENSSAKYIIFIDSDDTFYDFHSISKLYNEISMGDYDFVNSVFYKETNNGLERIENDVVWLHGKIYKREFLKINNIKFNDSRSNEDNGFNTLIILNNPKEKYLDEVTYIYHDNKKSITRKNNHEFKYTGMFGYIFNISWALNQKKENKEISKIAYAALYAVYLKYIEFTYKEDIQRLIKEAYKLYEIYKLYPFSIEEKNEIESMQFNALSKDVDPKVFSKPYISFSKFLEMVGGSND